MSCDRDSPEAEELSFPFMFLLDQQVYRALTLWRLHEPIVHYPVAEDKLTIMWRNELNKVVSQGNSSQSIEGVKLGATLKVTGNTVVFDVAQDPLSWAFHAYFTTSLVLSYLKALSR